MLRSAKQLRPLPTIRSPKELGEGAVLYEFTSSRNAGEVKNISCVSTVKNLLPFKKGAFTLAETLITLAIIGIVAALTIPSLVSNYQEKVLLNQLQAAYNLISNATERMIEDEQRDIKYWGSTVEERIDKYQQLLPKYLKVVKTCDAGKAAGSCNAKRYKWLIPDGSIYIDRYNLFNNRKTVVLANGVSLLFANSGYDACGLYKNFTYDNSYSGQGGGTYGYGCASFYVDINGKKGPNEIDKDIFQFWLVRDGVIPAGMPKETIPTFQRECGKNATNPYGLHACTAWALINKNMDYLKCSGLSWNGKQSCKD